MTLQRCKWAQAGTDLEKEYHDQEWGIPVYDDQVLFEFLVLEGAQAGLSWSTILARREGYREAFDGFNVQKVSKYDEEKIHALLQNSGIIRNKLKVSSAVINAKAFIEIQKEFGSFSDFIWGYMNHKPIMNRWERHEDIPTFTELSKKISKDLKKRGFKFVGETIIYAYMQAVGMVNDHTLNCFCHSRNV